MLTLSSPRKTTVVELTDGRGTAIVLYSTRICVQNGDMKRRPGNGIAGAMVCTSLSSLLRPLFYFLDDVSYEQSVDVLCKVCSHWLLVTLLVPTQVHSTKGMNEVGSRPE